MSSIMPATMYQLSIDVFMQAVSTYVLVQDVSR